MPTSCYNFFMGKNCGKILVVALFGIAFGLVEATVVVYIRQILEAAHQTAIYQVKPADIAVNLGFIAFLKSSVQVLTPAGFQTSHFETWREAATIVMLVTLAAAAGKRTKERLAYFLLSFGLWDIFYYIFLAILVGWPRSLFDIDVYFLIPVAWVGPVATPVVISLAMVVGAIALL